MKVDKAQALTRNSFFNRSITKVDLNLRTKNQKPESNDNSISLTLVIGILILFGLSTDAEERREKNPESSIALIEITLAFLTALVCLVTASYYTERSRQNKTQSLIEDADRALIHDIDITDVYNLSIHTKAFVQSFDRHWKFSALIEEIGEDNLMQEEKERLEKFRDPITLGFIDIPVSLNERHYDLTTLLKLNRQEDPFTKENFSLLEISSLRSVKDEMNQFLKTIDSRLNQEPKHQLKSDKMKL